MFLNSFWLEDDPLRLKHVAKINTTDNILVLTALPLPFILQATQWDGCLKIKNHNDQW